MQNEEQEGEMNVQDLRQKLQEYVYRLESSGFVTFHSLLKQFWDFLSSSPILMSIFEDLVRQCPSAEETAEKIVRDKEGFNGENDLEWAAMAYFVIKKCVESDEDRLEAHIGILYRPGEKKYDELHGGFNQVFLESLHRYLNEKLDQLGEESYSSKTKVKNRFKIYSPVGNPNPLKATMFLRISEVPAWRL